MLSARRHTGRRIVALLDRAVGWGCVDPCCSSSSPCGVGQLLGWCRPFLFLVNALAQHHDFCQSLFSREPALATGQDGCFPVLHPAQSRLPLSLILHHLVLPLTAASWRRRISSRCSITERQSNSVWKAVSCWMVSVHRHAVMLRGRTAVHNGVGPSRVVIARPLWDQGDVDQSRHHDYCRAPAKAGLTYLSFLVYTIEALGGSSLRPVLYQSRGDHSRYGDRSREHQVCRSPPAHCLPMPPDSGAGTGGRGECDGTYPRPDDSRLIIQERAHA